ncbi:MAG: hypothetical protein MZV70_67675 [Desulfobacterales bacterium]|nr:hypothetical protein [Desulfobacterales bacterium]
MQDRQLAAGCRTGMSATRRFPSSEHPQLHLRRHRTAATCAARAASSSPPTSTRRRPRRWTCRSGRPSSSGRRRAA